MADVGAAGAGHGGGGAVGPGLNDRQELDRVSALLEAFEKGKVSLSVVLNDDAAVTFFLKNSGKVDQMEFTGFALPDNYQNDDAVMLQRIISLLGLYHGMGISRRKILFLKLVRLQGGRGLVKEELVAKEKTLVKDYMYDKDSIFECYAKVKRVRAHFLRAPEYFKDLPELKTKM